MLLYMVAEIAFDTVVMSPIASDNTGMDGMGTSALKKANIWSVVPIWTLQMTVNTFKMAETALMMTNSAYGAL